MPEAPASNPSNDLAPATSAEPTPAFRRFPWVQLVFCLACLTMAAWTWMRYSYCWAMEPCYLSEKVRDIAARRWPDQAFVRIAQLYDPGVFFCDDEPLEFMLSDEYLSNIRYGPNMEERAVCIITQGPDDVFDDPTGRSGRVVGVVIVTVAPSVQVNLPEHHEVHTYVDSRVGRFHPTSTAGLVVGAMGCFIFGLYLRAWLRERKAAA